MANQILARLTRTMASILRIGNIQVKDSSGSVQLRNAGDTSFVDVAASKVRVQGTNATNYVALDAPDSLAGSSTFKLPATYGTAGFVLADTDAAGTLGFVDRVDPAGDTMTGDLTFTAASIVTADTLSFNVTYSHGTEPVGTMYWDTVDGTINMALYNGATLQTGQELHFYGKASGNIANGELCQFAGVQGDHILIKRAVASEVQTNPHYVVGVATQNITNGSFGYVTWFGKVNGVYTKTPNNNDSVDWTAGDILFFSNSTGQLTKIEPTAPNLDYIIAAVIKKSTGSSENGIIIVRPTIRIDWNETDGRYVVNTGDTMTGALFIDGSSNVVQLTVQGHSTQTANLQEWQNSAGTVLTAVDEIGQIGVGTANPTEKLEILSGGGLMDYNKAMPYVPYVVSQNYTIPANHQLSFSGYYSVNTGVTLTVSGILYIVD
jgi:hypothetical protein